jgi:hypothetical protein
MIVGRPGICMLALLLPLIAHARDGSWDIPAGNGAIEIIPGGELPAQTDGKIRTRAGGTVIADSNWGDALRLNRGEHLTLDAPRLINRDGGAVVFWVRPHWDGADAASHTFLSFPWLDGKSGYFTLSRGWWEPAGAQLTYLIGNNQDHAHVSRHIRFDKGEWTQLACVWQRGSPGKIRLYVNGLLAAENKLFTGAYQPASDLILGSDGGTPLAMGRWADADFAKIAFFRRGLSDSDIRALYERQQPVRRGPQVAEDGAVPQTRAMFDEGIGWQTESGAREIIRRIKKAGFNVYVPCVWHGNGARYPTAYTLTERNSRSSGADPLGRLISIAHENGIQVHVWFTVALREPDFARDHPEFYDATTPSDAFDVHRPVFRSFMVGLMKDFVQRYPVDGINLDYVRTMGTCRCTFCADAYRRRYNRDLLYDDAHPQADGTLEPHLQEWHDSAVEDVVRDISHAVKSLRPACILSVDGNPQTYANREGRQEARWANAGFVDIVYDMDYAEPPDVVRHHLVMEQFRDPGKLLLLIANYDWKEGRSVPKNADSLASTVAYMRRRWGKGLGVYLYSMLSDEQVERLGKGPFGSASRALARSE